MTAIRIIDDHVELASIGNNTHAQIDTHITANPDGTAVGQLFYWDGSAKVAIPTAELFWDDANKRLGIGNAAPTKTLDIGNGYFRMGLYLYSGSNTWIGVKQNSGVATEMRYGALSISNAYDIAAPTNGLYVKGDVGIGINIPSKTLGIGGLVARNIGMERGTVANTAGFALTLNAGGATSAATNKDGGDLILDPGVSTGSGESGVQIRGCVAGAAGTADRAFEVGMRVLGNKIGFHAITPIAQQILATGGGATVDSVITALQNLGLVSQS